jgi:hypothetical protein
MEAEVNSTTRKSKIYKFTILLERLVKENKMGGQCSIQANTRNSYNI